jgi:hypothetical protein
MEDLIYILLIACAVAVVVAAAVTGFLLFASLASVCVFGAAVGAFATTIHRGVIHRGGANAASGPGEPSFRAYYRGQVWRDLRLAAHAGWAAARAETEQIRNLVPTTWDTNAQTAVRVALTIYAFVGLALGAALAAVIGLIPALAITLFAGGAWALGAPLRALERLRRRRTGAYFDCEQCHDRFPLPQYVCPICDARHTRLAPGPFGVLRHRCTCGARLPAVQFRGRERLAAECPQGHPLGEGVGVIRTFHVPVAGGPSTGKSTYLAAALIELDEAAQSGTLATTVQRTSKLAYDRTIENFRNGVRPAKTDGLPPAMVAEIGGKDRSALLYAYDVAGETYGSEDELRRDPAHGLADGVVLLVDPFALDRVKSDLEDEINAATSLQPSVEAPQRMLERLIGVLGEQGTELSKVSAAICVTKIDALGIGDRIAASPGSTDHERTRAWLEQEGGGNFLRAAEDAFGEVQCFGVSALGRMPDSGGGAFAPEGAAAPLLWLLGRAGIVPATPGEAQQSKTEKIAATQPPDVSPKRPIYTTPLDAPDQRGYFANFGIGAAAIAALALVSVPAAQSFSRSSGAPAPVETASFSTSPTGSGSGSGSATQDPPTSGSVPNPQPPVDPGLPPPKANSPEGVIRRHFQRISDGDYHGAFMLLSARFRAKRPNWASEPSAAQPYVNVTWTGATQYDGGGVAHVPITFYGHDKYDTKTSNTNCNRFGGVAQAVREGGKWRYDPFGNHLKGKPVRPSPPQCNR